MTNEPLGSGDDDSLLADVFSSDRDRGADIAASEPDDPVESERQPPRQEAEAETDEQQVDDSSSEQPHRQVPLRELLSEREKRKEFEKRLEDIERESKRREEEWQRQRDDLTRQLTQPRPQPQPQQMQPPPDPFTDPEGYTSYRVSEAQRHFEDRLLNFSETTARRSYGSETVDAAYQAAQSQGLLQQGVFLREPDPWGAMVEWHKQHKAQQEIGGDLEAYNKRIEERIRQQVLAELKAGGGGQGQGNAQKFPGTLADQTAAGVSGALPQSDEAMADEIFSSERRNKQRFK